MEINNIGIPKIILHIGLHKTGSTFLQEEVSPKIIEKNPHIIYNPKDILEPLGKCFRLLSLGNYPKKVIIKNLKSKINQLYNSCIENNQILFLSDEGISQSLACQNYLEHFNLIKRIFENCQIILILRYQPDWIVSCYRHFINSGIYCEIEDFLNFKEGKFLDSSNQFHFKITKIKYFELISLYSCHFGKNNVHIMYYEDLESNRVRFEKKIFNILNVRKLPTIDYSLKAARGLSALSIKFILLVNKLTGLHMDSIDILRQECYTFKEHFDNQIGKSSTLYQKLHRYGLGRLKLKYLHKVLHIIDKIYYYDDDMLKRKNIRNSLDKYFKNENLKLLSIVDNEELPNIYVK